MLLSKACEYAIKACIYIASIEEDGRKASAEEISQKIMAPKPFTSKILKQLGQQKLVSSTKGPRGGFYMTKAQANRPLMELITAIDGNRLFTGCALGLTRCLETRPCPLHSQYSPIRDELATMMSENSISGMAASYGSGQAFLASLVTASGK